MSIDEGASALAGGAGSGEEPCAPASAELTTEPQPPSRTHITSVLPAAIVAAPLRVPPVLTERPTPSPEEAQRTRARIDCLIAEARATGGTAAAPLWFEAGRLYEHELQDFKGAAGHYQESHNADPQFLPVIHAARRLFAQLGKWGMCLMLIDEELHLPGAPVLPLLVEKARIFEARLGRAEDAVALYLQVVSIDPGYAPALEPLARSLELRGAWQDLASVLRAGAQATKRVDQRVAWLLEAGRVFEARLSDEDAALTAYEHADRVTPGQRMVLESLRRIYARRQDVERLDAVLEQLAETADSPLESGTFRRERARLLSGAGYQARAAEALEQARKDAPNDPLILGELASIYERLSMWSPLVGTLEAHARSTRDRTELLLLFAVAGKVADEKLNDPERAIRLYSSCVEVDFQYSPALVALGKLFARLERHAELARVYEIQVAATSDPLQKVNLLFKLAEHLAEHLHDRDGALKCLEELLVLRPGWVPALKLMASIYSLMERWELLVETYELELRGMPDHGREDRGHRIFLLEKVAAVMENHLGDAVRAAEVYRRVLDIQPGYLPALRALGRLYARLARWDDLLSINDAEARLVSDQHHIVALLFKSGEILAEKLNRPEDAVAAYRRALSIMPNHLPALMALGNILSKAGRYHELIAMHREEADVARHKHERANILFAIAQVYDEKLQDAQAAMAAYRAVLSEDPDYHPALRGIARLASLNADWVSLLDVYQLELAALSETRDRAHLRCRIAEILDRRLGRHDDAVQSLHAAIADSSYLLAAHEQLVALLGRLGRADEEVKAREAMHEVLPDLESRVANLRAMADHALHRLDEPARALDAAQRILREVPLDRSALRLALGCALRLRDHRLAVDLAEKLAQAEPAREEAASLHLQVAMWKESHLDPPEDPLPNYIRVLEYEPDHPSAIRAVERMYVERQEWSALFSLYERERAREKHHQPLSDVAADLCMKLGELAERRLGEPEAGLAYYEEALAARPGHLPAITRLKEMYGRLGRAEDQLRILSLEAMHSKDPQHAIRTLMEVGALQRDRFGDLEAALECFLDVLDRDPFHTLAYQASETILVTDSRWDELSSLYMHRSSAVAELNQRVELLTKAAHILGERLKRHAAAAEAYEGVIALVPDHTGALLQLGNIRFGLQEWDAAVQAYDRLVQVSSDPILLIPVHDNLGTIYIEHRADPQKAIQHLTASLAMQPDNRDVRKRLARAYALAGSPAQALSAYKQLLASAVDTVEKRELHLVLARLFQDGVSDLAQASAQLEQAAALTVEPGERQRLLDAVAALCERAGNLQGLVQTILTQAEQSVASDPGMAADHLFRAGQIQLERMGDAEGAMRSVRRGLEAMPENVELRAFLAELYARTPNQALAIEEHRRILRSGRVRPLSVRALFQLWSAAHNADRAFVAAEVLSFLGVANATEESFFTEHKKRVKKDSREGLEPQQLKTWVLHPAQRNPVHDILVQVLPDLAKTFADTLEPVDKRLILKPKTDDHARRAADEAALNVGVAGFDVHLSERRRGVVRAYTASPMVLALGVEVLKLQTPREQRFLLGRELMAMACGHTLIRGLDVRAFGALLTAICRHVDKGFPTLGESPDLDGLTRRVGGALSRKTRGALAESVAALARGRVDLQAFLDAAPLTEARAGLLLAGAFDAAVRLIAKEAQRPLASEFEQLAATLEGEPRLLDLVGWAVSEDHFNARQALRLAVEG